MTKDQIKELSEKLVEVFKKHTNEASPSKTVHSSDLNKQELFCLISEKLKTLRTMIK